MKEAHANRHWTSGGRWSRALLLIGAALLGARAWALDLSPEERAYLQEHPTLRLCVDPDWMPYEKLESDGRYVGLVADYMGLFQERLGISLEPTPVATWAETQARYRAGECDLVSALNATPERVAYLDFTAPYLRSPAVLAVRAEETRINRLEDLHGRSLGMVKGYVYDEHLRSDHPEIRLVYVENMQAGLAAVAGGELDATLGPLYLVAFSSQEQGLGNLKMVGNTPYQDELRVGVRKGDVRLLGIFGKLIDGLTPAEHARLKRSWTGRWRMRGMQ